MALIGGYGIFVSGMELPFCLHVSRTCYVIISTRCAHVPRTQIPTRALSRWSVASTRDGACMSELSTRCLFCSAATYLEGYAINN